MLVNEFTVKDEKVAYIASALLAEANTTGSRVVRDLQYTVHPLPLLARLMSAQCSPAEAEW